MIRWISILFSLLFLSSRISAQKCKITLAPTISSTVDEVADKSCFPLLLEIKEVETTGKCFNNIIEISLNKIEGLNIDFNKSLVSIENQSVNNEEWSMSESREFYFFTYVGNYFDKTQRIGLVASFELINRQSDLNLTVKVHENASAGKETLFGESGELNIPVSNKIFTNRQKCPDLTFSSEEDEMAYNSRREILNERVANCFSPPTGSNEIRIFEYFVPDDVEVTFDPLCIPDEIDVYSVISGTERRIGGSVTGFNPANCNNGQVFMVHDGCSNNDFQEEFNFGPGILKIVVNGNCSGDTNTRWNLTVKGENVQESCISADMPHPTAITQCAGKSFQICAQGIIGTSPQVQLYINGSQYGQTLSASQACWTFNENQFEANSSHTYSFNLFNNCEPGNTTNSASLSIGDQIEYWYPDSDNDFFGDMEAILMKIVMEFLKFACVMELYYRQQIKHLITNVEVRLI